MTKMLEKAIERVQGLPQEQQDQIAALILDEIDSERRWDGLLAGSQDKLAKLAQEAAEDRKAGRISDF